MEMNVKKYSCYNGHVLKEGKNLAFDESSVTFEDGTTVRPDLVIFSTGYRFSFPFLDDDIIEY